MTKLRTSFSGVKRPIAIAILVIMVMPPVLRSKELEGTNGGVDGGKIEQIHLAVGRSTVIRTDRPIVRVSLSTPEIADAMVTSPRELVVHAKTPGTISLLVWSDTGRITTYEVNVRRDLAPLEAQIRTQFPQEPIAVASNGKDVVLSGVVSAKYVIDRTRSLAAGHVEKPENIVNLMQQQQSPVTNQVMLKVRFAEVSRSAMQELGASFFTGANGKGDWIARGTTQQFPAPEFDRDKGLVFSDFLNLFAFNTEEQLGTAIRALKGRGLFQSLAEPNLITQDGKEASFLAGGEYPYPVVQGGGSTNAVTIVFKEFGIRLRFTPTITTSETIHLKVMPEVSTLDFGNAVVLEGFRIPALSTRRAETEVELRDGQTFAIAGLIDRNANETLRRVPGIGDIPILGYLFRSQHYQKNNTELVVMITPHIVRRDSPGVTPNLPGLVQPFLPAPNRTIPMPPPAFPYPSSMPTQPAPAKTVVSGADAPVAPASTPAVTTPVPSTRPTPSVAASATADKPVAPATVAVPAVAPAAPEMSAAERKAAQKALKEYQQRVTQERKAAELKQKRDAELQKETQRIEAKRASEQAAIDRKRWLEQQKQAAEAKVVADKLAKEQARRDAEQKRLEQERLAEQQALEEKHKKEQDKLEKERAGRNEEIEKLLAQYKKLTENQQSQSSAR
jgi:pilus assembly protein CpaC